MSIGTLNVLNGLSAIIGQYGHDGALKEEDPVDIGLAREEGDPILDGRIMDGFNMKVYGDKLCLTYNFFDQKLSDFHEEDAEKECKDKLEKIKRFVQKEFRSNTGKSLGLKEKGKMEFEVEYISRVRVLHALL